MKKIAIITATRAEYGLLYPLILELRKFEDKDFRVELIVTGTHLYEDYGMTINNIIDDNVRIDEKIRISIKNSDKIDIVNNQADALVKFANVFEKNKYNGVVILGDRYEMLMAAIAATDLNIPIIHLYGGDITEGAIDESIRHSITKMSYLHFPSNDISRKRIIQLGENPDRVFNFGGTGIDNIVNMKKLPVESILNDLGIDNSKFAVCTYHPVTLDNKNIEKCICDFMGALSKFPDISFIITKSNADYGGSLINSILDREKQKYNNIYVYSSLGIKRYLSLLSESLMVIGNSSSGILEAPSFHIPTINIGDRQKGRLQSESIINCKEDEQSIIEALNKALDFDFRLKCKNVTNPYGDGRASIKIAKKIYEVINSDIDLKKKFFDLKG